MNESRIIVITGGAGGLGTAVTNLFLSSGDTAVVPVHSVESGETLRETVSAALRERLVTPVADMLEERSVGSFFQYVNEKFARIEALLHLVGGVRPWAETAEMKTEDWDGVVNLNLRSAFLSARESMKLMKRRGSGSIVTVSAMTALKPEAKKSAYAAAKAGLIAFTRALADEGRFDNINANAVVPSIIRTQANLAWAQGNEAESWVAPEEIAETIYYLTSPAAKHINGTVVRCFGKLNV